MTPSSKARFMIGSCQARENDSNYVYHTSMNEENLRITIQSCFDFFSWCLNKKSLKLINKLVMSVSQVNSQRFTKQLTNFLQAGN